MKQLMLKVTKDRVTRGGFTYPAAGPVECPDWNPEPECGGGLHGWLNGEGDFLHDYMDGTWLVIEVDAADVVSLDGGEKVKIRCGEVVHCGTRASAVRLLIDRGALNAESNPGWCCFGIDDTRQLAYRSANRAVGHAIRGLRARGRDDLALKLEALPKIVDKKTAEGARVACRYAATAYATAAYAADTYAAAADTASAASAAASADAAAADAAAAAAYATAAAAAAYGPERYAARDRARAEERAASLRDRRELLGLINTKENG